MACQRGLIRYFGADSLLYYFVMSCWFQKLTEKLKCSALPLIQKLSANQIWFYRSFRMNNGCHGIPDIFSIYTINWQLILSTQYLYKIQYLVWFWLKIVKIIIVAHFIFEAIWSCDFQCCLICIIYAMLFWAFSEGSRNCIPRMPLGIAKLYGNNLIEFSLHSNSIMSVATSSIMLPVSLVCIATL